MVVVLVVDDDKITRKTIGAILKGDGHHLIFASDGARALCALEDNPHVELLIVDVVMPVLDGRELVTRVRANASTADLPTLIMSATVKVREIRALLEAGAGRFLAKPVAPARLLEEVDSILIHSKTSSALAAQA
jgi:CheY-like chemotaxis protein